MNVLQAGMELEKRIYLGQYGASGDRFPPIRDLLNDIPCSYTTVAKAVEWLRERGVIRMVGCRHYITVGRCAPNSDLEKILCENRQKCFGFMANTIDNHYYSIIANKLHEQLQQKGYDLLIMINDLDKEVEKRQLQMMMDMGVCGVFFYPHRKFENYSFYEHFPLPVVCMGRRLLNFNRNTVTADNYCIGELAAKHLLQCASRHFIYIGITHNRKTKDMRMKGFVDYLQNNGVDMQESNIIYVDDANGKLEFIAEQIAAAGERTGVFCYHDLIAITFLQACLQKNMKIPSDVGIVGCDDLPITTVTSPGLTTLHYPFNRICQLAIENMFLELEGNSIGSRYVEVPPRVAVRESTACPPVITGSAST